jgi:hypothetical protein
MNVESRRYDHDSPLAPLVIDLISEGERAEIEESIDAPLVVERFERHRDRDSEDYNTITVGNVGGGRTFDTRAELRADLREDSESGSDAASDSQTRGDYD